jgi:hypothetical protein
MIDQTNKQQTGKEGYRISSAEILVCEYPGYSPYRTGYLVEHRAFGYIEGSLTRK